MNNGIFKIEKESLSPSGRVCFFLLQIFFLALVVPTAGALTEEQEYAEAWDLCQAGKYSESAAAFNRLLKHHPRGNLLPEAHFTLARIEASGNNSFAHYQFILDNYPNHQLAPQASYATAQYYQNVGAQNEAAARYQLTYSRYSGTAAGSESLYRMILLLLASDSAGPAGAYTKAFIEKYPQNPRGASLLNHLAGFWRLKNDTAQANECWSQVLELYPQSYEAGEAREQLLSNDAEFPVDAEDMAPVNRNQPPDRPAQIKPEVKTSVGKPSPAAGKYYLQVGVYRDQDVLGDWKNKLSRRNYSCRVDSSGTKNSRSYRLLVGPYPDKASAFKAASFILEDLKVRTIMVQR
jgi:TolA-binding protein